MYHGQERDIIGVSAAAHWFSNIETSTRWRRLCAARDALDLDPPWDAVTWDTCQEVKSDAAFGVHFFFYRSQNTRPIALTNLTNPLLDATSPKSVRLGWLNRLDYLHEVSRTPKVCCCPNSNDRIAWTNAANWILVSSDRGGIVMG